MASRKRLKQMQESSVIEPRLAKALSHPLRVEILAEVNKAPLSPKEFRDQNPEARDLSGSAYHFRVLERYGFIEVIKETPRRGVFEHYYAPITRAFYGDIDWENLPDSVNGSVNLTILRTLSDQVIEAIQAETLDSHDNSHFTWTLTKLDEQGWDKMMGKLKAVYEELHEEGVAAAERMVESGEKATYTTIALAGFESPQPKREEALR
jgi:DNA-binding transcriptional ArsR family regulator